MASSYQGLRESLQTALQQTDLMDNQGTTPNVSDLPSFLQELLHRHPPNFGDETPDAGSDDCSTTENDTSTEESSSALSQACGSESDDGSIVSTTSDPNQLSSAVVGAFIEYYVSEKFRKVQDRASSNGEPAEHSNMTEHNDEQTEQLKAEKKVLEDRLSKLKATVHESIVSECGGTVSVAKTQCQSLDETIKCICRINVRLGIVQDQKTDDPMLHLPPNSQEAGFTDNGKRRRTQSPGPTESESRARSFSVNAKSWGEIKEQQDSDCALLKVLLGKGENFLNDLLHFTSGTSRHSLPDELDTALEDMRKGNDAPPENQDVNHFTMVSFAELFIAWLWCIKVPTEGFEARKVSEAIFFKTHAPLIVGRFIRSLKSEVAHCLACVRLLWAERDRTVNAAGTPIILDSTHHGVLRPHQLSGVRFLWREIVQETQPGGALLAHEMGLGKTLQIVTFLSILAAAGSSPDPLVRDQVPGPLQVSRTIVLCPAALTDNWVREFEKWRPEEDFLGPAQKICATMLRDDRFENISRWYKEGGVLLISYELFRSISESNGDGDRLSFLERSRVAALKNWLFRGTTLVIADEAHKLQSQNSQISRACFKFSTARRIALTGSPLSNTLEEYYRMFEWLSPGRLGGMDSFKTGFIKPIERGSDSDSSPEEQKEALIRMAVLNELLGRKIDRVGISVLEESLPPKHEFRVMLKLSSTQRELYNLVVQGLREGANEGVSVRFWSWLDTLQLCCNHPALLEKMLQQEHIGPISEGGLEGTTENPLLPSQQTKESAMAQSISRKVGQVFEQMTHVDAPEKSSRVIALMAIINESSKAGDKILVFSHSIPTISYLETVLAKENKTFLSLTGEVSMQVRQDLIDQFNSPGPEMIFLISTRAGGVGLNIQAANRVVIFDFSFNPTWESQAIGRAYRIGQTKPVFVYRFITTGTFEEQLWKKVVFKSELAVRVVDKKPVPRLGTKSTASYLRDAVEAEARAEINEEACRLDPVVMPALQAPINLQNIHGVQIAAGGEEIMGLSASDWIHVLEEVRAHRLRHAGGTSEDMA